MMIYHWILNKDLKRPNFEIFYFVVSIYPSMLSGLLIGVIPIIVIMFITSIYMTGTIWDYRVMYN